MLHVKKEGFTNMLTVRTSKFQLYETGEDKVLGYITTRYGVSGFIVEIMEYRKFSKPMPRKVRCKNRINAFKFLIKAEQALIG